MADMMVNLRLVRDPAPILEEQLANGIEIRRAHLFESVIIADWVREKINPNWGVVCEVALEHTPPLCFVAYENNSATGASTLTPDNIVGFACYDVVTKGVFGPSAVRPDHENTDVGTALLLTCLHAMSEDYTEAVIGWAGITDGYSGRV